MWIDFKHGFTISIQKYSVTETIKNLFGLLHIFYNCMNNNDDCIFPFHRK